MVRRLLPDDDRGDAGADALPPQQLLGANVAGTRAITRSSRAHVPGTSPSVSLYRKHSANQIRQSSHAFFHLKLAGSIFQDSQGMSQWPAPS
jgi:hypothetical protein